MANYRLQIGHPDNQPAGLVGYRYYWLADVDASKPVAGLNVGDLCWAVDTGIFYVASGAASWLSVAILDNSNNWTQTQNFVSSIQITNSTFYGSLNALAITADRSWAMPNLSGLVGLVGTLTNPAAAGMQKVNATAQTAAIASTNLTNATVAGLYRISYFLRCTTADITAGGITASFTYTDNVGATTDVTAAIVLTATTSKVQGSLVVYLASGNITYLTTLTGIAGTSQYQLRARCEYLG